MSLFSSKKNSSQPIPSTAELSIQKIPDIFYGGNNPVIYEPTQEKSRVVSISKPSSPKPNNPVSSSESATQKSRVVLLIIVLGLLVIGGASAYYVYQYRATQNARVVTPSSVQTQTTTEDTAPTSITPSITTSTSIGDRAPSTTPSLTSSFLEFPSVNLGTSADTDLDQLTDVEEVLYGIDSGTWDTDQDGYYDGQEVINLYSPRGGSPMKLIDSGLVREYINQFSGYRVYYPLQWNQGGVDAQEKHMLFSAISGEYVEIRVFEKSPGSTFSQWFQIHAPGEQFSLLSPFTNRFGFDGWKRTDGLVVYFDTPSFVFTIIYQQVDTVTPVPYRTTMEMMYQSFRPTATSRTLPEQIPLVLPSNTVSSSATSSTTAP